MENIRKFAYTKKGITSEISVFILSEDKNHITGIKLNDLSDTDVILIKKRFKDHIPDKEITFGKEREKKLRKISGMKEKWIKVSRTFKKPNKKLTKEKKADIYCQKGIIIENDGNYKKAKSYYKKAIELNPKNRDYKNKLQNILKLEEKNYLERQKLAKKSYDYAIKLKIDSNYSEALKYLNKAIKLDPNNILYKNKQKEIEKRIEKKIRTSKIKETKQIEEKKKSKDNITYNSSSSTNSTGHLIIPNHKYWKDMYH